MDDDRWDRYRRAQDPDWEPGPSPPPPWLEYVERILLHLTIVGLVALVLVQMLLTQPPLRRLVVFADRLEGVDWEALLSRPEMAGRMRYPGIGGPSAGRAPDPDEPAAGSAQPGGARAATDPKAATGAGAGTDAEAATEAGAGTDAGRPPPAAGPGEGEAPALGRVAAGRLTVTLISQPSAPGAYLLLDGRRAADFRQGSVTVRVRAGQRVEVDGRAVLSALTFRVTAVEGLSEPRLGEQITTDGDLAVLGVAG